MVSESSENDKQHLGKSSAVEEVELGTVRTCIFILFVYLGLFTGTVAGVLSMGMT